MPRPGWPPVFVNDMQAFEHTEAVDAIYMRTDSNGTKWFMPPGPECLFRRYHAPLPPTVMLGVVKLYPGDASPPVSRGTPPRPARTLPASLMSPPQPATLSPSNMVPRGVSTAPMLAMLQRGDAERDCRAGRALCTAASVSATSATAAADGRRTGDADPTEAGSFSKVPPLLRVADRLQDVSQDTALPGRVSPERVILIVQIRTLNGCSAGANRMLSGC
jgi:hypothetical protein